ncbi:hypothetical protein F7725_006252, partial [Dissostichus mawsoni]
RCVTQSLSDRRSFSPDRSFSSSRFSHSNPGIQIMSLPRQLRDESATIADIEEKKGFIDYFLFVIEVRTKGGGKYLIYRRYRDYFNLHQILESRYSPEDPERPGPNTCTMPSLPEAAGSPNMAAIGRGSPDVFLSDGAGRAASAQSSEETPTPPPKSTVKPKMDVFSSPRAEVMFDFRGNSKAELDLKKGDVIFLLQRGTVNNQTGIFPQSFVKIIKPLPGKDLTIQPTYKELLSRMRNVFKEDDISINYRDAEGDLIRILEDEDVQLMIRESRTQRDRIKRPANQFLWEIHVSATSDLSVYNSEA